MLFLLVYLCWRAWVETPHAYLIVPCAILALVLVLCSLDAARDEARQRARRHARVCDRGWHHSRARCPFRHRRESVTP